MCMIRTIHPVGQGAFYTETFEDDVIVYDCGSKSGKEFLHREIDTLKGKIVKALFISHFHADHINGVKYLLSICKVEYIFVPFLSDELKIYYACLAEDDFCREFVIDSQKAIDSMPEKQGNPKVIYVSSESNDSEDENAFDLNNDNNVVINSIPSGTSITYRNHISIWEYIPYNLPNAKLEEKIWEACDKNLCFAEVCEWNDENWKNIKKIFTDNMSSRIRNEFSMVLYSGAFFKTGSFIDFNQFGYANLVYKCKNGDANGCLYTGDCDMNGDIYEKILKKYKSKISNIHVFQIPHHGAKKNFNFDVLDKFGSSEIFYISVGLKNRYGHPNGNVIANIVGSGKKMQLVTEAEFTKLSINYKY